MSAALNVAPIEEAENENEEQDAIAEIDAALWLVSKESLYRSSDAINTAAFSARLHTARRTAREGKFSVAAMWLRRWERERAKCVKHALLLAHDKDYVRLMWQLAADLIANAREEMTERARVQKRKRGGGVKAPSFDASSSSISSQGSEPPDRSGEPGWNTQSKRFFALCNECGAHKSETETFRSWFKAALELSSWKQVSKRQLLLLNDRLEELDHAARLAKIQEKG